MMMASSRIVVVRPAAVRRLFFAGVGQCGRDRRSVMIKTEFLSTTTNRQFKLDGATSFSTCTTSSASSCSSSCCLFPEANHGRIFSSSFPMPSHPLQRFNCSSSSSGLHAPATEPISQEIVMQRLDGLPVVSVPMPSRQEKCRFVLKPLANTLSDFASFLKIEDAAIEHVAAYTEGGELIPGLTTVDVLLRNNFYLHINDKRFLVKAPQPVGFASGEKAEDLSNVMDTVARLFRALHSDQFHNVQQRHLLARLEEVKMELQPLEKVRQDLHLRATKRARVLSWVGLGLMGLQFGFLARLTWWEYSWDIMEPVTYFVTCGTAMAMFAYHVLAMQDYSYPDTYEREVVMTIHRLAKKNSFDVPKYNRLQSEKARLEFDLERLRNPIENKINPPYLPQSAS